LEILEMNESTALRLMRALGVIFLIVLFFAFWQVWLVLGLAFLLYVYAKDRGERFPRIYFIITLPFKLIFGKSK
jgi:hypothetical protein